jgi:beta-lactamase regulating signal transducer with metallopeptidase domain
MLWLTWLVSNVVLSLLLAQWAWLAERYLKWHTIARSLWLLALLKLITPPLVSVPLVPLSGKLACAAGVCGCGPHASALTPWAAALPWVLLAGWSAGAVGTGWTARRRWTALGRLTSQAAPAGPEWQALAASLCRELSLRRPPRLLVVSGRMPPSVVPGWRGAQLLLPLGLINNLTKAQRTALLLHELIHIQRRDHLARILELAVGLAYWWLPIVGAIGRRLRACEETCCDAAVVAQRPEARREYARLLLDVVDFAHPLPGQAAPQATAMAANGELAGRLRAILGGPPPRRTRPAAVLVCLACGVLPCQLHYDLAGRRAATGDARLPAAGRTLSVEADLGCEIVAEFSCPT